METIRERFVPALGLGFLTPLYDPVVRLTTRESAFKAKLLAQAGVRDGERVLDVGCGTGTLALALKGECPGAVVTGIDADRTMLARAERKAEASRLAVAFDCGSAERLPYAEETFDAVVSSLFFHHLTTAAKRATFAEMLRCLKPGGRLHVADWGGARGWTERALFLPVRLLDGFATTADNIRGRLPGLMAEAGFSGVVESTRVATPLGALAIYRAGKPATENQGG